MNRYHKFIFLLLLVFGSSACQEIFDPEVDFMEPMIVVDGLITTKQQPHVVKLHYSLNYNDPDEPQPIQHAEVIIRDSEGNELTLVELQAGHYYAPDDFTAEVGETYVLDVSTADGLKFRSHPQEVLPVTGIDSIYGRFSTEEIVEINNNGDHIYYVYKGTDSFVDINSGESGLPKMRFEPRILLLYGYWAPDPSGQGPPVMVHAWRKYGGRGLPSVNFTGVQTGQSGVKNNLLCFIPKTPSFYRLAVGEFIIGKYIIVGQYRLNDDSHAFHRALRRQLEADGNLFDPIAAQLPGNMFCVSDPSVKILGLFEASAWESTTFRYVAIPEIQSITYTPYMDLDHIPRSGESFEVPFFW